MRERIARIASRVGSPLCVGLVLGLIRPFGTFDLMNPLPRMAYWLAVVSANWLLADVIVRRVDALAGDSLPVPRLLVPLIPLTGRPFTQTVYLARAEAE